jgi:hypothetical protein
MSSGTERERQFSDILDSAESNADALRDAALRARLNDPELSDHLALVAQLAALKPSRAEVSDARLRVGQRLSSAILAGEGEAAALSEPQRQLRLSEPEVFHPNRPDCSNERSLAHETLNVAVRAMPPLVALIARRSMPPARRWLAAGALVVTALIVFATGLTALSALSLPESPLYGVKRAEETILLALPLDHVSQVRILSMVALRRLSESNDESEAGRDRRATELVHEFNADVKQMIVIAISPQNDIRSRQVIAQQIADVLQAQTNVRQSAIKRGDKAFSQALTDSQATIQSNLQLNHITLPPPDDTVVSGSPTSGSMAPTGTPSGAATPSNLGTATPTAPPAICTPSSSHGKGHDSGGGSNNCNSNESSGTGG